ncbi:hypothetical protein A3D03_03265 [Candidatus Gottesmanbacteria bacterium RIFCSPHIGHO2_02_FULL_40_13]|uniref:PIN domain-containing protein n=1 Tax=Candidatus Gottesmanbacteria bacterium RIFCSPHIGHO2_02_FULL_40_13 TaxID=1798384 RepID=A0A1F6A6H2_9BACT|nr:MAG: hypothetical protein A3D03_03265 [Candidatus Gottesmanbacteria bacterium RIFCSPHIGHO2_02_FULL_40_13]
MKYFLDTNIFLRALLNDHPIFSPECQKLIQRIKKGKLEAFTSDLVIAEIVFILGNKKRHAYTKSQIKPVLIPLLSLEYLSTPSKPYWKTIFAIYVGKNIDFIDAYNAVVMESQNSTHLYSYDRDFEKIASLKRHEP